MSTDVKRFTRAFPCPVCGGGNGDKRKQGERCFGFLSADGQWAHCTREEYANGNLKYHATSQTYAHKIGGPCHCGTEHRPAPPGVNGKPKKKAVGSNGQPREKPTATYDYLDADGNIRTQTFRFENPKRFLQGRPDPKNPKKPIWGITGVETVLYRLPELLKADPAEIVFIVEGEKDVDRLTKAGLVATCNPMGAGRGKWLDRYNEPLRGRSVVIVPDNDDAGREHSEAIAKSLDTIAAQIKVVNLPGLPEKGDVSDYLVHHTIDDLLRLVGEAKPWQGEPEEEIVDRWPKPSPQMFHGIAGELVEMVKDRTEADPVALLIQFLVAFGNIVGRGPHFVVNKTCHYMVLFVAIIGATASGRKGTAFDIIRYLLRLIEDIWADRKIKSGLVSGEGLIYHVRDHKVTINKKGEEELEPGVDDKRLLVVETEMSRMLKAMNRENSTLSDVIRQSWDGHILDTMGKHNPDTATGAHVSLIGHCTRADLAKHLTDTDSANGLGNRFLWTCSRKSKDLPDGDNLSDLDWDGIASKLRMAIDSARQVREMSRDDDAAHLWRQLYIELGEEKPGLLGSLINRGQAYVMRLACIYALLDQSSVVRKEHLGAAYAVWEYCEKSARFVFGDSHGDPEAEKLLKALRDNPNGLTQTEINANVFQKNTGRKAIAKLLGTMLTNGMIHCVKGPSTGGRPPVRWFAGRGNAPTN